MDNRNAHLESADLDTEAWQKEHQVKEGFGFWEMDKVILVAPPTNPLAVPTDN